MAGTDVDIFFHFLLFIQNFQLFFLHSLFFLSPIFVLWPRSTRVGQQGPLRGYLAVHQQKWSHPRLGCPNLGKAITAVGEVSFARDRRWLGEVPSAAVGKGVASLASGGPSGQRGLLARVARPLSTTTKKGKTKKSWEKKKNEKIIKNLKKKKFHVRARRPCHVRWSALIECRR